LHQKVLKRAEATREGEKPKLQGGVPSQARRAEKIARRPKEITIKTHREKKRGTLVKGKPDCLGKTGIIRMSHKKE